MTRNFALLLINIVIIGITTNKLRNMQYYLFSSSGPTPVQKSNKRTLSEVCKYRAFTMLVYQMSNRGSSESLCALFYQALLTHISQRTQSLRVFKWFGHSVSHSPTRYITFLNNGLFSERSLHKAKTNSTCRHLGYEEETILGKRWTFRSFELTHLKFGKALMISPFQNPPLPKYCVHIRAKIGNHY